MRIQILHDLYWNAYKMFWRNFARISPKQATIAWYKKKMGVLPDLENPKKLTEKLQYLKLNDYFKNDIVRQCADKYAVREYVRSCGCDDILNELYAVYNDATEIEWGGGAGAVCVEV